MRYIFVQRDLEICIFHFRFYPANNCRYMTEIQRNADNNNNKKKVTWSAPSCGYLLARKETLYGVYALRSMWF